MTWPTFGEAVAEKAHSDVAINPAWVEAVRPVSETRCVVYLAGGPTPRRVYLAHPMHEVLEALGK